MVKQGDFCMVVGTTRHEGMHGGCQVTFLTRVENGHVR